jgi:hypothetical protein
MIAPAFLVTLSTNNIINNFPDKDYSITNELKQKLKLNVFQTMVCAVRISKNVLNLLKLIANKQKRLYFHELLLISIVKHNKLSYKTIPELEYIKYRDQWKFSTIKLYPYKLFHPIKDLTIHQKLLKYFSYNYQH